MKLEVDGDVVREIWFDAYGDEAEIDGVLAGLQALDTLAELIVLDYREMACGRVRDAEFMALYRRALVGD